jgi:hypothetical protein
MDPDAKPVIITVTAKQTENKIILSIHDSELSQDVEPYEQHVLRSELPTTPEVELLAQGDAEYEVVDNVRSKINQALLGSASGPTVLTTTLQSHLVKKQPVHLIFKRQLRRTLLDLMPVELLQIDGSGPLVLSPLVSIMHSVAKSSAAGTGPPIQDPFRILLIRSDPKDYGKTVPPAVPIRTKLLSLRPDLRIDVISSEASVGDGVIIAWPTEEEIRRILTSSRSYSMLVFLGHGGLSGKPSDAVAHLLLETPDGFSRPRNAQWFSVHLQHCPITLALLVACFSAASPMPAGDSMRGPLSVAEASSGFSAASPVPAGDSVRGSLSVAEALVSGFSEIRMAIGMRHRVNSDDAEKLLSEFIPDLIDGPRAGFMQPAIQRGRLALTADIYQRPAYAAPMVFIPFSGCPEPLFGLTPPRVPEVSEGPSILSTRNEFWDTLRQIRSGMLDATAALIRDQTDKLDAKLVAAAKANGRSVIMPKRVEGYAGETALIDVYLHHSLGVYLLAGALQLSAEVKITRIVPTFVEQIESKGYKALFSLPGRNSLEFRIENEKRALEVPLISEGPLFQIEVALPEKCPEIVHVVPAGLRVDPEQRHIYPGPNAIIVRPPRTAPAVQG